MEVITLYMLGTSQLWRGRQLQMLRWLHTCPGGRDRAWPGPGPGGEGRPWHRPAPTPPGHMIKTGIIMTPKIIKMQTPCRGRALGAGPRCWWSSWRTRSRGSQLICCKREKKIQELGFCSQSYLESFMLWFSGMRYCFNKTFSKYP